MIKAIAFDPGKTTGFATGEMEEGKRSVIDGPFWGPMMVQTAQALLSHGDIHQFLASYKPDYIICERFDFRNKARTGLELISREFIGIINLYCELNPDCTLVMQSPGQVLNGHFSPDKLKKLSLWRKDNIHANEACMHLLYWGRFGSGFQYCRGEFRAKNDIENPLFK